MAQEIFSPLLTWSTNSDREPRTAAGRMLVAELVQGPPKATESLSVKSLERLNIIGLYLPENAPEIVVKAKVFFLQ